jgi:hypothetical protein
MTDLKECARKYAATHKDATLEDAFIKGFLFAQLIGRWRSVNEILPELGQRVIITSRLPGGYIDVRIANLCEVRNEETGEVTMIWTSPINGETVTHWMMLPMLPDEASTN